MPIAPPAAVPPESAPPSPVVEVIAPAGAPHLRQIADELAGRVLRQIETLPPEGLHYLLRVGAEIARARDEYERFRRRLGVK